MGVPKATTIVSETGLSCPHWAPRESAPLIESHGIRAGQAPLPNRLVRHHLSPEGHLGQSKYSCAWRYSLLMSYFESTPELDCSQLRAALQVVCRRNDYFAPTTY